jgi:hypothetical protein
MKNTTKKKEINKSFKKTMKLREDKKRDKMNIHDLKIPKYSLKEKENIVQQINPVTIEQAEKSFQNLRNLKCKGAIAASASIQIGNDVVDKFTLIERLNTKGHVGIDFYTFWYNRAYFSKIGYIQNMLEYYRSRDIAEIRKWKYIFNLYFSSISIFRPVMAMEIYCKYTPKIAILDPTMGWGGRLIGACALNLPKYIGIDANVYLDEPYRKMMDFVADKTTTKIEVFFQDALTIDYSQLNYDMVFTSPPYYNIEIYRKISNSKYFKKDEKKTKEEWNSGFYKPLFKKTWENMKSPGYYCLNIPAEIYEECCVPILGKYSRKIALKKQTRTKSAANKYSEYIYIWYK